jgi:hypothetical protein
LSIQPNLSLLARTGGHTSYQLLPFGWRGTRLALLLLTLTVRLPAVIFYSTADPAFNSTAPTGSLAGSGWQWVGNWNGFQGTPIGPHHFLTARHVDGVVGNVFILDGISYTSTKFYDDTVSDLRIVEVSGTFPTWASLYRTNDEVGKALMVFGRGLGRGAEVRVNNVLKGWQWGTGGGVLRWGQNVIASTTNGGSYWGDLLYAAFDKTGGTNEAHLALGDSSGPIFINDGTTWKLAGIAAVVDAYFNTTNTGAGFNAAIFDARGLYVGNGTNWSLFTGGSYPVPSGFYATRLSVRTAWIDGIVTPESVPDSSDAPLLSPTKTVALATLLFGIGARTLRSSSPTQITSRGCRP